MATASRVWCFHATDQWASRAGKKYVQKKGRPWAAFSQCNKERFVIHLSGSFRRRRARDLQDPWGGQKGAVLRLRS